MRTINVGFGNYILESRILAILNPDSAPMKRFKEEARERGLLVDVTQGRRTRAMVLLDSGHLILSGVQSDTLSQRIASES